MRASQHPSLPRIAPAPPLLSRAELIQVCDFIYQRTGMLFGETKRYYVDRRVADRMVEGGHAEIADYIARLPVDASEAEALINSFTVNETYFYREAHQLECLGRSLLPDLIRDRRPGDKLRLWSIPCATGEEAYSLAIWLLENWRLVDAYNIEIVGSDIDTRALAAAEHGLYGDRAIARLPRATLEAYFEPPRVAGRRLISDLRESVTFTASNLVDADSVAAQGRFDVIFCRNVLIYFDEASRRLALELLHQRLNPGGFLCLGHSETLDWAAHGLLVRRFPDAVVYQRAGA